MSPDPPGPKRTGEASGGAIGAVFQGMDRTGSGFISQRDVAHLVQDSAGLSGVQAEEVFRAIDPMGTGFVTKPEFERRVRCSRFFRDAKRLFDKLDKNNDGLVSFEEVESEVRKFWPAGRALNGLTHSEIAARIVCPKTKQKITFQDFLVLLVRVSHHIPVLHALAGTDGRAKFGLPSIRPMSDSIGQLAVEVISFTDADATGSADIHNKAYQEFTVRRVVQTVVAGSLGGAVAKSITAPFTRVKLLFQVTRRAFSIRAALGLAQQLVKDDGVRSLWKGNSAMLLRTLPYVGIHYLAHDICEHALTKRPGQRLSAGRKFVCGGFAGVVGTMCTYPLDMLRCRLAVDPASTWGGVSRGILAGEGLPGFYRGLIPTLAGIVPYTGTAWLLKGKLNEGLSDALDRKLSVFEGLACGATAGLVAQAVSYPLEMTRRRMQMPASEELGNTSVVRTFRTLLQTEGTRGLFKGFTLNVVKGPIAIGISFATFDRMKEWFGISKTRR